MADNRIRGEDVEVRIISDGELENAITAIRDCEFEDQREIKTENYLGERTARKDDAFMGVRGRMSFNMENGDFFDFMEKSKRRAKRETPSVKFNVVGTFVFPDGTIKQLSIPDVSFGSIPVSVSGRTEYVQASVEWEAADYRVIG